MQPLQDTRIPPTLGPLPPPAPPPPPMPGPTPPPPPTPRPARHRSKLGRLTVSAALLAVGMLAVVDLAGADVPAGAYPALGLAVVGVGLVVGGWYGHARSLIAFAAVLSIPLLLTSAIGPRGDTWGGTASGTVTWRPTTVEQLDRSYSIGAGDARLDLSALNFNGRSLAVDVSVGVGSLTVVLPSTVDATVQAHVGVGEATVFGEQWSGINQSQRTIADNGADGPGGGQLTVQASVDLGDLEVQR